MTQHSREDSTLDGMWLARLQADWAAGHALVEPPEWVTNRARRLFRDHLASQAATRRPGIVDRIRAVLVFDSWNHREPALGPTMGGVRSASLAANVTNERQMLFQAPNLVDIDIRFLPNPDGRSWRLQGQVAALVGKPVTEGRLNLVTSDTPPPREVASLVMDRLGQFHLPSLSSGRYDFLVDLDRGHFSVLDIDIEPPKRRDGFTTII